ncbi:MAG TPA: hypothetical protein VMV32_01130 [Ignavibacteriaceae bacterium]|nr:hypothetical protein [Ignavibacteriaceae bacterium]
MIKSKLSAEEAEQKKKGNTKKPKPYPVPEEDSFIPPDDDSAEIKYMAKEKLAKTSKPGA